MTPGVVVGGKYRLMRVLGQGAMGEVWAAVNESTGKEVALKLLSRPKDELRHRLLREARACGKLRHRNIIDVHDVGETDDGDPFLVMALLTGETLADRLDRQRRLDPLHAVHIARDIARALAAAHKAGIVHRDLKPANVFLHHEEGSEELIVKVLDFGVSKDLEHADGLTTIAGATVGSPAYMSPEQARSARDLDHRTDLWSLGVVLFEMLVGKRPFDGDAHQVLARISFGPIPHVSHCVRNADPALAAVVARCLERDREKRFGSAEELAAALDRFARPNAPAPTPSSPGAQASDARTSPFPALGSPLPVDPEISEDDDDGEMPTRRWNRDVLRGAMNRATVSPPGADMDEPIDAGAMTLPDAMEISLEAPPPARMLPLGTSAHRVPSAPRFDAPPLESGALSGRARGQSSVLSSMAPVVQPAGAASHDPAIGAEPTRRAAAPSTRNLRAPLLAIGGAMLVLLGALAARALHARPPSPAAPPPPAPTATQEEIPPSDAPRPEPTITPAETAVPLPPSATTAQPPSNLKQLPSRKYEPNRPNAPFAHPMQKPVKANPRGI